MKDLIVITHDTYGSGLTLASADMDNINDLADGAFAVLDYKSGDVVDLAAASADAVPAIFQIAYASGYNVKTGAKLPVRLTGPIVTAKARKLASARVAPVAKVMVLGATSAGVKSYNLPTMSNLPTGISTAGVQVIDTSKPHYDTSRVRTYEVNVDSASTEATITTALLAKINADASKIVNVAVGYSGSTTSIEFTAITAGTNFEMGLIGVLQLADRTVTTSNNVGNNTTADLIKEEYEALVEDGNRDPQNRVNGTRDFFSGSQLDGSLLYNNNIITYKVPSQRDPILNNGEEAEQMLQLVTLSTLTAAATGNSLRAVTQLLAAITAQ